MPDLGSRKLSAMLAAMLEVCPRREENTRTLAGLFLHHLPRELRIFLVHEDLTDLKLLAAKADTLHTHHRGGYNVVNAMANTKVNAEVVTKVNVDGGGSGCLAHGRSSSRDNSSRAVDQTHGLSLLRAALPSRPGKLPASASNTGYGQQAFACKQPSNCSWSGNGQAEANYLPSLPAACYTC